MKRLHLVVMAALVGFAHDGTPYPMLVAVTVCSAVALLAMLNARAARRRASAASGAGAAA